MSERTIPLEDEILARLASVLYVNLNNTSLIINRETALSVLPGMDSIKMVNIILDVEDAFGLRFSAETIDSLNRVEDLIFSIRVGLAT